MTDLEKRLLREKFGGGADLDGAERRLADGEPFAYILGEWYFMNETYEVSPAVLIPRPDTEHLTEAAVKALPKGGELLDLCTGSGCVGISALCARPDCTALLCDLSEAALDVASRNAVRNGVSSRASLRRLDVLSPELTSLGRRFPVVTANPPYIRTDVIPTLETVRREPHMALDGGADGLVFYRALLSAFDALVGDGGAMLLEIGYDQGDALRSLAAAHGLSIAVARDYGGNDRVVTLRRAPC